MNGELFKWKSRESHSHTSKDRIPPDTGELTNSAVTGEVKCRSVNNGLKAAVTAVVFKS